MDCDAKNHQQIKFLLSLGDGQLEEIIPYNELSNLVNESMVKSATYSSEFMATCHAMEQIINLCYTLCRLGVPLDGPSWLFGNNKCIVMSSMIPC